MRLSTKGRYAVMAMADLASREAKDGPISLGEIAESQEFATAARHVGLSYPDLLHRIVALGMRRGATTVIAA